MFVPSPKLILDLINNGTKKQLQMIWSSEVIGGVEYGFSICACFSALYWQHRSYVHWRNLIHFGSPFSLFFFGSSIHCSQVQL